MAINLFDDEITETNTTSKKLYTDLGDKIYNWWLTKTDDGLLLQTLPAGWYAKLDSPRFKLINEANKCYELFEHKLSKTVGVPAYCMRVGNWDRRVLLPPAFHNSDSAILEINNSAFYNEAIMLVKAREELLNSKQKTRDDFVSQVTEIMNKCTTVNQLVKAWPAAERLLNDELKARLHKPNTRASAKKIKTEIETDTQVLNRQLLKKVL